MFILIVLVGIGLVCAIDPFDFDKPPPPIKGHICAYGDMDRDLYTDIIVQDGENLKIYYQSENGHFSDRGSLVIPVDAKKAFCSIGDFDGDSNPDILVSKRHSTNEYEPTIYFASNNEFILHKLDVILNDEPSIMDVNGDGKSDVVGFMQNGSLFCQYGVSRNEFSSCLAAFKGLNFVPSPHFPHAFVDLDGDMSAEIVFGTEKDGKLVLEAWKRISNTEWRADRSLIAKLPAEAGKFYGAALIADFDADGFIDIGIPWCSNENCGKVEAIKMWSYRTRAWQIYPVTGLDGVELVSTKRDGNVVFRAGDFSLDGYPDLIALVRGKSALPMILANVPCTDCITNASRKFELRTSPRLIQPADVAVGRNRLAAFFDLKEDGNLDVLLEFVAGDGNIMVDFIRCGDKGDTTFLKVQVFSSSCDRNCGSDKIKIGSGIAWNGACVTFTMSDSWGHAQTGAQCQLTQTSHRVFHTPFVLFGLGRSPNFVDWVHIGTARLGTDSSSYHNQRHDLKQIVPNSRIIIVPPKGDGYFWQSRLYLTPSQLIIQSLIVLISVCMILLLVVGLLHFRERRADRQERQAQSHRFHFDAM
ncbi:hypothetical protein AB6A40_004637 [Gnathostoma spinigerum]|uniref:T-cell immunomodulatory protein TIP C2 domain-containing protein n=1 Tax=Gnathostoma spinigerum TaxID=75299 RepID=A0ABD6ED86_9BILA